MLLIGTPVYAPKAYALDRWFAHVAALAAPPETRVLLLDNSEDLAFTAELQTRSQALPFPVEVAHVDLATQDPEERVGLLSEQIRQRALALGADWFALDIDVLIPPQTLTALLPLLDYFAAVTHAYPARGTGVRVGHRFGCALIRHDALAAHRLDLVGEDLDPLHPHCWHGSEPWFLLRLARDGFPHAEIDGLLDLAHLGEAD